MTENREALKSEETEIPLHLPGHGQLAEYPLKKRGDHTINRAEKIERETKQDLRGRNHASPIRNQKQNITNQKKASRKRD